MADSPADESPSALEPVQSCRVLTTQLVKGSGFFSRDYTVYEVVSKIDSGAKAVLKRFSEFESFHTALEPALAEAVAVRRQKADALMEEARRAMHKVQVMQKHADMLGVFLRYVSL